MDAWRVQTPVIFLHGTLVYQNSIYVSSPYTNPLRCGACTWMMAIRNNAIRCTGASSGVN